MNKLTLLADDLTGALDSGVFFSRLGSRVMIDGGESALRCLGVRHMSASDALGVTARALEEIRSEYIYLKTDSLYRGHIGAQLEALCESRGAVFFAPAYPENGRTLTGDTAYLYGVRLTQTEAARDIRDPIESDNIKEIISRESRVPVRLISPGERADPGFRGVTVCGAQSAADLDLAAKTAVESGFVNFAGCAGFARALGAAMGLDGGEREPVFTSRRLFAISSSASPAALEQLSAARAFGLPGTWLYEKGHDSRALGETAQKVGGIIKNNPCSILAAAFSEAHIRKNNSFFGSQRLSADESAKRVAAETAACAVRALSRAPAVPFVIGGDTLLEFCTASGIVSLEPCMTLAQGVICSIAVDSRGREKSIISKAGSFGAAELILDLADRFFG